METRSSSLQFLFSSYVLDKVEFCLCRLWAACNRRSCLLIPAGPLVRALRSMTLNFKRILSKFGSDAVYYK